MTSWLECAGCGWRPPDGSLAFACAERGREGDADHVLVVHRDPTPSTFPIGDESCPFVRFRRLMLTYDVALARGWSDARYVECVERIDERIRAVDGRGFEQTPLFESRELAARAGAAERGPPEATFWIKNETVDVAGSHKARHLMGIAIALAIEAEAGAPPRPLAIASCGNAALAAAVVARAIERPLDVFIPTWADERVVARLTDLGARLVRCPREPAGPPGDPCYVRFRAAVADGSLPFSCQGGDNGLTLEGGKTIAWEIAAALGSMGVTPELLAIQVGGGALASALSQGFSDAAARGALEGAPRLCPVQSEGGHPLERAWHRLADGARRRAPVGERTEATTDRDVAAWLFEAHRSRRHWLVDELAHARAHRSAYMWPLEHEPRSVATGILDDETYDWLQIVRAMVATGGVPLVVPDETIVRARDDARAITGVDVDATGAAGLAGLYVEDRLARHNLTLLTGVQR